MNETKSPLVLTPEQLQRQRSRSKALGIVLGALVFLLFAVTIAKLGINMINRGL